MAIPLCDECGQEPGRYMVTDQDNGNTRAIGVSCFALVGLGLTMAGGEDYVDGVLKVYGYAPTKATRDARKAAQLPPVDPGRTIIKIVESGPRPAGGGPASDYTDESTDTQVGLSTFPPREDEVDSAAQVGAAYADAVVETDRPDADDPAPY